MALRLNNDARFQLDKLAQTLVQFPELEKAMDDCYAALAASVRADVERRYPPADMQVLQKYGKSRRDRCIRLQLGYGDITQFGFKTEEEAPWAVNNCNIIEASEETTRLEKAFDRAREIFVEAREAKLRDYYALIRHSRTLEQVVDVWPEAEQLRSALGGQAIAVISDEVRDRIRADVAARSLQVAA